MRRLSSIAKPMVDPVLRKHGRMTAALLTQWPAIVGATWAAKTKPIKVGFKADSHRDGVLHLAVRSADAPEIQHSEPIIVERINVFFGYAAIGRLKLDHRRIARHPPERRDAPPEFALGGEEERRLSEALAGISPSSARTTLASFGRAVFSASRAARRSGDK